MKKTIPVHNTQVHLEGTGQNTIVMLHGWPDTHESWRQQIDFFKSDRKLPQHEDRTKVELSGIL